METETCALCDDTTDLDLVEYITDSGESVTRVLCESCRDDLVSCEACDEVHESLDSVDVQNSRGRTESRNLCESCVRDLHQCSDCSEYMDNVYAVCGDDSLCESCYCNNYFTCDGCNEVYHTDSYGEDGFCDSCREEDDDSVITKYGYNPGWVKHRGGSGVQTLCGVELEVECKGDRYSDAETVQHLLGDFAVLSEDGSLNDGFEIRTHPATLAKHREYWSRFWSSVPKGLRSHDTETCGLHVHVERDALESTFAEAKLQYFLHNPDNREWIRKTFARRDDSGYAKFVDEEGRKIKKARAYQPSRYEALNWCLKTVEFRIYKGTLKADTFWSCVEFSVAAVHYANALRSHATFGTVPDFCDWCRTTPGFKNDYPQLLRRILACV